MTFILPIFAVIFFISSAGGKTFITISTKDKSQVLARVSLKEFQSAYSHVKKLSQDNAPKPKKFLDDYTRYLIGVEEAYKDKTLVKDPKIKDMFTNPLLRQGFDQLLYKLLAETKLQKQIASLDKKSRTLSPAVLKKFYRKNPEYDFHFIQASFPENPNSKQLKEAKNRIEQIYKEVRKSKKNFPQLVSIYSDSSAIGGVTVHRTQNMMYPSIFKKISKMKKGQISKPFKSVNGFYIVKFNRKVPFEEANHTQIKAVFFDQQRTKIFNNYFNKIQKKYFVQVNKALLKQVN